MCDQVSTNILPQIFFQKFHLLHFVSFIQLLNIALESNIMVWFTLKVSSNHHNKTSLGKW